jgi:hypothetical protein
VRALALTERADLLRERRALREGREDRVVRLIEGAAKLGELAFLVLGHGHLS